MTAEKNNEEFFGQLIEKPRQKGNREFSVENPLLSIDKRESPKKYEKVLREAEEMAKKYDLIQLADEKKIHFTVLNCLNAEYQTFGRPATEDIKEKVKAAALQLIR